MPTDDFTVSVTQNIRTDLAAGRLWRQDALVHRIAVYAPAAATSATVDFFMGKEEVLGPSANTNGTAPTAFNNEAYAIELENNPGEVNILSVLHSGAAAQNFRVIIDYD